MVNANMNSGGTNAMYANASALHFSSKARLPHVVHAHFAKLDKTNNAKPMVHQVYSSSTSSTLAPRLRCWTLLATGSAPVVEDATGFSGSSPSVPSPLDDPGLPGAS